MNKTIKISDIVVGDRARTDLGDLQPLAESIAVVGVLRPPIVTSNEHLISGERRVAACKLLGRKYMTVRVAETCDDASRTLFAESGEVSYRKPFAPSEAVKAGAAIERLFNPQKAEVGSRRASLSNDPAIVVAVAAAAVGMSRQAYQQAKAVLKATECNPERFSELVAEMDSTGRVEAAFCKIMRSKSNAIRNMTKRVRRRQNSVSRRELQLVTCVS